MPRYNLLFRNATFLVVSVLLLASLASAQYWFQSGARGANSAGLNNGASVTIQTVYQNATNGSLGFWVGESLANGAFIQAGYEITNATGYYSTSCGNSTKSVFVSAGVPTWFWEYFMPYSTNSSFCGGIGPDGSAGRNGSFNTYGFRSVGNVWSAYFNNQQVGSINLGTSNSGPNPPSAFAEYAETSSNKWPMRLVEFKNLLFYLGNVSRLVPQAYPVVSYGKGSMTSLPNPYGVREVGNYVSDFQVGSSISNAKQTGTLWQIGYTLRVSSSYGNLTGSGNYSAYSIVLLNAPLAINISNGTREVFLGWVGHGVNSYTGNTPNPYVTLYSNTTETATWKRQYYLNATTEYGTLKGAGWYDANSTVQLSQTVNVISLSNGTREVFRGWNTSSSPTITIRLNQPRAVHELWARQYYLSVLASHGNTTGTGWYDANSLANVSINNTLAPINNSARLEFYNWSNGNFSKSIRVKVSSPIKLNALFKRQYLVLLEPTNSNGEEITDVAYYNISGSRIYSNAFFAFDGKPYNIQYIYYKGVLVTTDYKFITNQSKDIEFATPIYDIVVQTQSVFGTPVNASLNLTFKNNTKLVTYSGPNGANKFHNVPYGYITGYAEYFGIKQSVNAEGGFNLYLTFLTGSLIAFILGGVVFIVIVARLASRHRKKRESIR